MSSTPACDFDAIPLAAYPVLLVEDEAPLREVLALYLRESGFTIHTADDGREALRLLEQHEVAMVVTDIMMPETDGLELLIALRKRWPAVRVIAISGACALDGLGLLAMARKLGAHQTLEKPIEPPRLRDIVQSTLAGLVAA